MTDTQDITARLRARTRLFDGIPGAQFEPDLKEAADEIDRLRGECERLCRDAVREAHEEHGAKIAELQTEIDRLRAEVVGRDGALAAWRGRAGELQEKHFSSQAKAARLEVENARLRAEVEALRVDRDRMAWLAEEAEYTCGQWQVVIDCPKSPHPDDTLPEKSFVDVIDAARKG